MILWFIFTCQFFSIVSKHTLIIKLFSLKIRYKQNQDAVVNWKIFISKEEKGGLAECEIVPIFRAKHENKVKAQRSEKLPAEQKCQSLFTRLCRKYCTEYKHSIENNSWFQSKPLLVWFLNKLHSSA